MITAKTAAVLATAAAAAFTVWLCTTTGEYTEPLSRKKSPSAVPHDSALHSASSAKQSLRRSTAVGRYSGTPNAKEHRQESVREDLSPIPQAFPQPTQAPRFVGKAVSKPVFPFAFRELPAELQLSPAQTRAVEEVQDQFIEALGGETADPATPEYRKKWMDTQRLADLQLRACIGAQAFAFYQRNRSDQKAH